ncbi:amidase family protein [Streptomyces virginiae]|uniref:amidase family protein n=1 Tax=Streptomyces virginiae TaxID=1961 RepID=UPI0033A119A2
MAAGEPRGPLHGIPAGLKDLIDVAGTATSASSRVREGHRARADRYGRRTALRGRRGVRRSSPTPTYDCRPPPTSRASRR